LPTSKDLPSSLVQLRSAVWTGDTRDTRPNSDIGKEFLLLCTPETSISAEPLTLMMAA
jgi:hypothetical protein